LPSKQLINKTLIFENIQAGENQFFNKLAFLDIKFLEENKIFDLMYFDIVVELEAIRQNGETECYSISYFKLIPENNKKGFKIKVEGQKLIVKGIWFEMHDVYGFNCDSNS